MNIDSGIIWHGRSLRGIVFDLDGTLTNSIDVFHEVFSDVAGRLDIRISRDKLFTLLSEGMNPWDEALPEGTPNRSEKIEEYNRLAGPRFVASLERVSLLPGVTSLLADLHDRGFTLGLVTDSPKRSLKLLHSRSIAHYFSAMITTDDGVRKKPSPEGLLKCLDRMEISPSNAVFVGDALIDVRAGEQAGTLTIGVLTGLANRRQFEAEGPTALVEDVTQLPSALNLE